MAYFDRIIIFQLLVLHRCSSYTATSYCRHMCQRSLTTLLNDWYNRRPQWALELNEVERWSICDRGRDNTSRIKLLLISGCDVMWYLFIQFPGLGHQMVVHIDAGMPTTIYEFWNHEVLGGVLRRLRNWWSLLYQTNLWIEMLWMVSSRLMSVHYRFDEHMNIICNNQRVTKYNT